MLAPETLAAINSAQLKDIGQFLSDQLMPATGFKLAVKSSRPSKSKAIVLRLDKSRSDLGAKDTRSIQLQKGNCDVH